jgi:hypothetical protein
MTGDRPTGAELLELAREVLQRELLPALPPEQRLAGLMVLNVMGIAARELEVDDAPARDLAAGLAELYGAGEADAQLRRLAGDIRAGRCDAGARHESVRALLWSLVKAKARAANPRLLTGQGLE